MASIPFPPGPATTSSPSRAPPLAATRSMARLPDTTHNMNVCYKIHFPEDSLASVSFSLNGTTLTYGGTDQITLSNNPVGPFVASADAVAGVDLTLSATAPPSKVASDFNGDGISD